MALKPIFRTAKMADPQGGIAGSMPALRHRTMRIKCPPVRRPCSRPSTKVRHQLAAIRDALYNQRDRRPNPVSSTSQSWHLEFGETVLKGLKIDPRSMLNQSLVSSLKIGQFPLLIQIFQNTHTADHRQAFPLGVAPGLPFVNQDETSRHFRG